MKSILIIFYLISISSSLKLDLIDDYIVKVYLGDSKEELKLLVDLTYSFTYILKPYKSNTKKSIAEEYNYNFLNFYGNYNGEWVIDTFHFKEENLTMEMRFIEVNAQEKNLLNVDGVLGLGNYKYNQPEKANIFFNLRKIEKNCLNNMLIYDKINKKIIICENDEITEDYTLSFPFRSKDVIANNYGVLNITKINETQLEKNNINKFSFIGLIPGFVIPKGIKELIYGSNKEKEEDSYKIFIEDKEYIYQNREYDLSNIKPYLDIDQFKSIFKEQYINYWYLGLGNENIKRIVIDYDKMDIKLKIDKINYIILILRIILLFGSVAFFIYAIINVFIRKKEKDIINDDDGQELMNL